MSRARELAKVGGLNQQVVAGLSSHVGVSTFAADVFMYSNLAVTGTTTFNGGTLTLGDAASDNVVFGADVNSHIIPNTDDTYDLGSATQQWRNLYVDGTSNLDEVTISGTVTLSSGLANTELQNSTVAFGGVSLALGGTDATPAFNLSDATNYPTSSLSGTITNTQLAGSIANSKLANDSVSFGGVSLDLGGTDSTPAFDLSDATAYPTSSLVGTITNTQLAGSIANSKLSNDSVAFGGVSLDLGGTDATPAFDLSDATSLPISTGVSGLASNVATFLGTPSSSNLRSAVTDETGTGALVFGTSPTVATPDITGRATMDDATLSGGLVVGAGLTVTGTLNATSAALVTPDISGRAVMDDLTLSGGCVVGAGLTITGDLTVNGTTTTINSTVVSVDDKTFELGSVASPSDTTADAGGIVLKGASDHTLLWYNDNDHWESSEHFNLVSGKSFQIADTAVLSATSLGSGVVSSSLTSVGTLSAVTVSGDITANGNIAGDNSTNITGIAGVTASTLTGTLQTAAQSNITSVGTLSAVTVSGDITANGDITGDDSTNITRIDSLVAATLTGTLQTAAQANITSVGTLSALTVSGDILPNANGTLDIGATGTRFANVFTSDLDLSNEAKGVNSVDGSWGSYLIEEGEESLFITNRRSGKTYRFMMEEV